MKENIRFANRLGHSLAGILHRPDDSKTIGCVLFAHCFTCTKNIKSAGLIAQTLSDNGFLVLRFDFTGLGASTGEFVKTNFSSNVDDLIDAAEFLSREHQAPDLLVGHSLGGTAIMAAASEIASAKAVTSIGSPAYPEHILHLLENSLDEIAQNDETAIKIGPQELSFNQEFVDDARSYKTDYKGLDKALMVLHSPIDKTVSVRQAEIIFSQAMHPKSFISLDDADHLLSLAGDAIYVGNVIAQWASRYINK